MTFSNSFLYWLIVKVNSTLKNKVEFTFTINPNKIILKK